MKHTSLKMNTPCEFVNINQISPLISHVQIKVCYVGQSPNRNETVITREVAEQMAQTLPGAPIVGFYNEGKGDFEGHKREIIDDGKGLVFKAATRPYGFVDLNAKVWFQKYLDDNQNEREYLCTEGYIWTGQYPEAQRIIDKGNNQSMELDAETLKGNWNSDYDFYIINEATISKLCILGDDVEPCFEGANVTKFNLKFDDEFKNSLYQMMKEISDYLKKGGDKPMFNEYAVSIGDPLWCQLYDYLAKTYPAEDDCACSCSAYSIEGVYEDQGVKFAVIKERANGKLFRLGIEIDEVNDVFVFGNELTAVTKEFVPTETPQFSSAEVEVYTAEYKKNQTAKDKTADDNADKDETEGEDKTSSAAKDENNNEDKKDEEEDKKKKYSLDEIPEYVELQTKYTELNNSVAKLNEELAQLREFKIAQDRKEKQAMIDSFYMLGDEDKKEVVEHINEYSLDEIESKLSVICVRNKVNFNLDEDKETLDKTTYNLNDSTLIDNTPAWIKAIRETEIAEI